MPSISGSAMVAGRSVSRRSAASNASEVPALSSQDSRVLTAAAIHAAAKVDQKEVEATPGTTHKATCMTTACPARAIAPTASQPMAAANSTSTGRISIPTRPVTAVTPSRGRKPVDSTPGSRRTATPRAAAEIIQATARRRRSVMRIRPTVPESAAGEDLPSPAKDERTYRASATAAQQPGALPAGLLPAGLLCGCELAAGAVDLLAAGVAQRGGDAGGIEPVHEFAGDVRLGAGPD